MHVRDELRKLKISEPADNKILSNPNFISLKANLNLSKNIHLMKSLIFLNLNVTYLCISILMTAL